MFKVGMVQTLADGFAFKISDEKSEPLVLFAYETQAQAESAKDLAEVLVENAIAVRPLK